MLFKTSASFNHFLSQGQEHWGSGNAAQSKFQTMFKLQWPQHILVLNIHHFVSPYKSSDQALATDMGL